MSQRRLLRLAVPLLLAGVAAGQGILSTCSTDSQCQNGGQCKLFQDVNYQTFSQCACANGYTGTLCTTAPNCPQAGVTCLNGGDCPDPGTKRCLNCPTDGITGGQFCELNVTLCDLLPGQTAATQAYCANGGRCNLGSSGNIYVCRCPSPFGGQFCERRAFVSQPNCPEAGVTCLNGGDCPDPGTKQCNCPTFGTMGFRGQFCEQNVTMCDLFPGQTAANQAYCGNGGKCSVTAGGNIHVCKCPPGFGGQWCQFATFIPLQPPPPPAPTGINRTVEVPAWVAAPILIGILVLLVTCGCLFFVIYRERKGEPVFTRLDVEGTRGANLHDFAASEEGKGGRIADPPPRYAASTPRTPQPA